MNQQKHPKKNNNLKNLAILSGIAFEMGVIIFIAVKGGKWLDNHYHTEKKLFTLLSTLLGLVVAIWMVLRRLKKIKN